MRSSYKNIDLNYDDIISCATLCISPKKIVEIGILDGYSLSSFIKNTNTSTIIYAYDLFETFNGNHSENNIIEKYKDNKNVNIEYGDFYELHNKLDNNIDILHVDIANNGDVLKFVMEKYYNKITENGIIIFEGGSETRDNIEWMNIYNKPKIYPIINQLKNEGYNINTFGNMPSITVIKKCCNILPK